MTVVGRRASLLGPPGSGLRRWRLLLCLGLLALLAVVVVSHDDQAHVVVPLELGSQVEGLLVLHRQLVEPELVRLFVEDEVQRLREGDDVPDVTLRTSEGDQWTTGLGTASVSGAAPALLGWLARGLTAGVAGDPLPRFQ